MYIHVCIYIQQVPTDAIDAMNSDLVQKERERRESSQNYAKLRSEFDALQVQVSGLCMRTCVYVNMSRENPW